MRYYTLLYWSVLSLTVFASCRDNKKCEIIQEWNVQNYRIVKSECPDMVLASFYQYEVYVAGKVKGNAASQIDSCKFTWQANNESYLIFNTCENSIRELKPHKILLEANSIDSVIMFSNELKQTKSFTRKQIEVFAKDWNNSRTRGYSDEPIDSAFFIFPAYQYRLTVYSKGMQRPFYGYNFIILDSSNWKFEIKTATLDYFHKLWGK